jgi:hypothetical protein
MSDDLLSSREIAAKYITETGNVRVVQLLGLMASSTWLTITGGWSRIQRAAVEILIREVRAIELVYRGLIRATLGAGADTIRYSWSVALESAINATPIFAPILFVGQLLVVFSVVEVARRRVL